jgi:CHAD domain-containing protein
VNAAAEYAPGMKETLEREIKLTPEEGFVLPELGGRRLPTRVFISTYHDTIDLRLARNGVTFRHRLEDGAGLWQLKLPRDAARLELELPGPPARPPAELVGLLPAYLRGAELVPVARLRTRREGIRARGAEIVDDSVAVLEGQHVTRRFREIEVELLDGDERTLRQLEKELRRAGAHATGALQPKLYRALDLAGTVETRASTRDTPPGQALGIAFENEYRALLTHDPGTRRGDDPEDLHQLRVATRRLRAFLRAARALVEAEWAEPLREELGWLGGHLGPARDLDVMLIRFREEVAALAGDADAAAGLIVTLEHERAAAYADVVETLGGERYYALLDRLEAAAEPPLSGDDTSLAKIFKREAKRMRHTFEELGDHPEDDALHASRIAVKRARYAADLAAHELGKAGGRFVAVAKQLQDILGDHQDAVVAQERIRAWADSAADAEAGFAAGRLVQLERDRMAAARATWRDVWRELDDAARRAAP